MPSEIQRRTETTLMKDSWCNTWFAASMMKRIVTATFVISLSARPLRPSTSMRLGQGHATNENPESDSLSFGSDDRAES